MKNNTEKNQRTRRTRPAIALFAALTVISVALFLQILPIRGESGIYEKILRLHVIADSDDPAAQSIKLSVRDAMLDEIPDILDGCRNIADAVGRIKKSADRLTDTAKKRLSELDAGYDAKLEIGREFYPTREYDGVRLPAGEYTSVRIILGSGEGKNWWCVLFPSLCLSAAKRSTRPDEIRKAPAAPEEEYLAAGFTPEQYRTITETDSPKYRIRFRFLEIMHGLFRS